MGGEAGQVRKEIDAIIAGLVDKEPESFSGVGEWESPWTKGSIQFSDRIQAIAEYCCEHWPGDLVEIGCFCGGTTSLLAVVAEDHGRRVIAVDPWQPGTANCEGWQYDEFLIMTEPWKHIIDVVKLPSQDEQAVAYLKERELCFVLIDGLHNYPCCYSDILAVSHCNGIIAVDDLVWNPDVERAFNDGARDTDRVGIRHELIKEGYLLP